MLGRSLLFLCSLIGAGIACQAPEIAQQYSQRLGGAVEELRGVVNDFDRDAARHGMGRMEAIVRYERAPDAFLNTRGGSISKTIARYQDIAEQRSTLRSASPIERPFLVMQRHDEKIMADTMSEYRPAVPTTPEGGFFGLMGFFATWILLGLIFRMLGLGGRAARA